MMESYPFACSSGTVHVIKFPDIMKKLPIEISPDHFGCAGSGGVSLTYNGGRSNIIFPNYDKNKIYAGYYVPSQAKIYKHVRDSSGNESLFKSTIVICHVTSRYL